MKIEHFSGYHKLPEEPELGYLKMSSKELDEYHRIVRIHEKFNRVCEGMLMGYRKEKPYSDRYCSRITNKKGFNIDSLYYDRAGFYHSQPGFHLISTLTFYGVKQVESAISEQIRLLGTPECWFTAKELEECILRNPHLHRIIKTNLYQNLKNYEKINRTSR